MVRVKTYIWVSPIHGLGVFAAEDIEPGTVTWEEDTRVDIPFEQERLDAMPEPARAVVARHPYKLNGEPFLRLPLDHAAFMNHSTEPNCHHEPDMRRDVAARKIYRGEELTVNYYLYNTRYKAGELEAP